MFKRYLAICTLLFSVSKSFSQISLPSVATPYTQDFNTLPNTGTTNALATLPAGWTFLETGGSGNTTYAADNGSTGTGNTYSYGTTGASDRALGGLLSGSVIPTVGASFTNNTGAAISSLAIAYTGEQWRIGALGRVDRLDFQYSTDATSLNTGTWADENNLDFTAPNTTSAAGALDGNATANKTGISYTITGLNIPNGSIFWIRWSDFNASGADDGLAVDDFSITVPGVLTPCTEPTAQPTSLVLNATANTVSGAFTVIPDPTTVESYLIVRSTSSVLSSLPVDGNSYNIGTAVEGGNGISLGTSADGSFTDNVSPSTHYYYFIFAINDQNCSGGPNYNQVSPLTNDITTPALAACITPAAPTLLTLTSSNNTVSGSFTGSGASKYLSLISTSPVLGATPTAGTVYSPGQSFGSGTVINYGASVSFVATGLTVSTQYYFYVFAVNDACTGAPVYSASSLNGNTTTTNTATGIPAGYYDAAAGLSCQPLKTALRNIISSGYVSISYDALYTAYQFTDLHRNDANTATIIWDMYSDNPSGPEPYTYTYGTDECGNYSGEGICYNREHSTPKAWFGGTVSPMYTDINHLFPTDGKVNGERDNYPYGEVTNVSILTANQSKLGTGNNFGYTSKVFEPINEYKGDFARASLYMATRYENEIIANNWSSNTGANEVFLSTSDEPNAVKRKLQIYDAWYLKTVFKWINQDPVSQKEIDRNNAVYTQSGQHNRNPYIDHPEYAALVFQCTGVVPVTITDFTAQKLSESVLLKWYATYETSFKQYDVERSTDGIIFNKIGDVTGNNLSNYSFEDNNLPNSSVVYYRLKMVDIDSRFKYSKIISVRLNNNLSNAIVFPNPTKNNLHIQLYDALQNNSTLQITDVTGRAVKTQALNAGSININLDVKSLAAGRYFVKIINNKQIIIQSFIVTQ